MRFRLTLSLRHAFLLTALIGAASARAIVSAGSGTTTDTTYNFVGYVDQLGGSGVAVGPHTFLTAGHVVPGGSTGQTFTLGGTTYSFAKAVAAPDIMVTDPTSSHFGQMTHVDLTLVTVNGTLPGYYNIGTSLAGTSVTMVGYGNAGTVNAIGTGYDVNGFRDGRRTSGTSTINISGDYYVPTTSTGPYGQGGGPVFENYLFNSSYAALAIGDSGGGWFQGNTLVGINDFFFNTTNGTTNLSDYGFANSNGGVAYFGSGGINLTDSRLRAFLAGANPVPEPSAFAAVGLGALAFLRRRKRA